ncbi:transposase [Actinokineospora sp. HUAS TT18]|uniref:transposase n=1 Tax=Actinokineospora sp. HUAS TT18 TaxID=3447451 RepID=UPI003F52609C
MRNYVSADLGNYVSDNRPNLGKSVSADTGEAEQTRSTGLVGLRFPPGVGHRGEPHEIGDINQRVHDLDTTIRHLVTPLAPTPLQITGISHNSAAVLVAEIGDITRFTTSAKLARYTGCAPIPVYSSDKERHRLHRGGNRRLNSVLYTAAIVQKRFHPDARHLLDRHEPAKGARGARRILQRHLIDVIHRAMTTDHTTWNHHITRHPHTELT